MPGFGLSVILGIPGRAHQSVACVQYGFSRRSVACMVYDMILNHSQVQGFADDTDMTRGRSSVVSFTETVESFSFAATRSATIF